MRDVIKKRLAEYRIEALDSIAFAENRTKATFAQRGTLSSSMFHSSINEDNKTGFAQYMDQSANFIRQVAPGSSAEYVDELWDGGHKLKQEIMANVDHENSMMRENSTRVQLKNELRLALDKLIERKVEDFEIGYIDG